MNRRLRGMAGIPAREATAGRPAVAHGARPVLTREGWERACGPRASQSRSSRWLPCQAQATRSLESLSAVLARVAPEDFDRLRSVVGVGAQDDPRGDATGDHNDGAAGIDRCRLLWVLWLSC